MGERPYQGIGVIFKSGLKVMSAVVNDRWSFKNRFLPGGSNTNKSLGLPWWLWGQKSLPATWETQVQSLSQEDPHSMDRGILLAIVQGVEKSWTRLSD